MFIILTYDVGAKRDAAVMKICRRYLQHVQRSVFEGALSEAKLEQLKRELERKMEKGYDTVRIYKMDSLKYVSKDEIGTVSCFSNIL